MPRLMVTNGCTLCAGAAPSSTGQPPRPPASKSSLNPDAKSFSFNPNAKEFKPLFSTSTTPAGTPFGTPAATPPATPGSSLGGASTFRQNSFGSSHFGGPSGASQWISSQRSHSSPANNSGEARGHATRPASNLIRPCVPHSCS